MSDREWTSDEESVGWIESDLADTKAELARERSFRSVYGAMGILAFLYGLVYGVYLAK